MAFNSSIKWTESTWNPITGCTKVSPGCLPEADYAEGIAKRLKAMGSANYENGFKFTLHEHVLELPLTWKKPQTIFVNSMSNLFHKNVPLEFIQRMFSVMNKVFWQIFQIFRTIKWVIVGGASGPGARAMKEEWVIRISDECRRAKVPFFFSHRDGKPKQWGGVNKKKNGRVLKGKTWDEMPRLRKVS